MPKLNNIKFNQNKITTISRDDFVGYENIIQLDMFYNKLKELLANIFNNLENIGALYIQGNQINSVSSVALNGLYHLNMFTLEGDKITDIPPELFKETKQRYIYPKIHLTRYQPTYSMAYQNCLTYTSKIQL